MLRKVVGAAVILAVCVGVAVAEEISGRITKISDAKVTFQAFNKDTKKYGDAKDYDLAKDVKVSMKKKNDKVAAEGGLKNDALVNIDAKKGTKATINVEGGKVTEIILGGKKKAQ